MKTDLTRNERQKRRRENERRWLKEHGFTSWEMLHTKLMSDCFVVLSQDKIYDALFNNFAYPVGPDEWEKLEKNFHKELGIPEDPMCLSCGHSESRHKTPGGFCKHCMCVEFIGKKEKTKPSSKKGVKKV